jgi:hypothetical protein
VADDQLTDTEVKAAPRRVITPSGSTVARNPVIYSIFSKQT